MGSKPARNIDAPVLLLQINQVRTLGMDPINDIDSVQWMWKSNNQPFDLTEQSEWTAYPSAFTTAIERAYTSRASQVCIDGKYMIHFKEMVQVSTDDYHCQRPVRRCTQSNLKDETIHWGRERFGFRLDPELDGDANTSASKDDMTYYGSKFVADWLLKFTDGRLKAKFDLIYPALVLGIQTEGRLNRQRDTTIQELIDDLEKVMNEVKEKKESKRVANLRRCCVKLYTKDCFLFRLVNTTLRDDDRTKLDTLGPYCYLVYNDIGDYAGNHSSVRFRLRQLFLPTQASLRLVYRGDFITKQKLDEYHQAVRQRHKYFRWLPFVSTSHERSVAELFAQNVLYIIELGRAMLNDQFTDLLDNTFKTDEEEVLLRPGVRFHVEEIDTDSDQRWPIVRIKVVPSYVSKLR